jgi:hypothetical protein
MTNIPSDDELSLHNLKLNSYNAYAELGKMLHEAGAIPVINGVRIVAPQSPRPHNFVAFADSPNWCNLCGNLRDNDIHKGVGK